MKILVTGFEPFNGGEINPSAEIVKRLQAPAGVTLLREILPVTFEGASLRLRELLAAHQPDLVLSIGQAGGRKEISVERVAINLDCCKSSNGSKILPDNEGFAPVDQKIVPEGAAAYFSTLPLWGMIEAIQAVGLPAALSNTAGTYVCNRVMYVALHAASCFYPHMKAGFVHVPFLPQQIEHRADKDQLAAMPLEEMVTALQAALDFLGK